MADAHAAAAAAEEPQPEPKPNFWTDGWRHVPKRIEAHSDLLEELAKMAGERAAIERKHARELQKFSKRWEERLAKIPIASGSSLQSAFLAVPKEASAESQVFTEVQQALDTKLKPAIIKTRKEKFARSLGKFKAAKENIKGFEAARKPWVKAIDDVSKSMKAYHGKKDEIHELHHTLEQAKTVETEHSLADQKKIEQKIQKAEQAATKAEATYQQKLQVAKDALTAYESAMRAQLQVCQQEEQQRIEYVKTVLAEYASIIAAPENQTLHESFQRLQGTIRSATATADLRQFEEELSVAERPEVPAYVAWVAGQAAPVLGQGDGKNYPGQWFVKAGETKSSRSHKRFFVLKGDELEYYATVKLGVPTKKRGVIFLKEATAIQLATKQINIVTNKRTWKMWCKKPEVSAKWAELMGAAVGLTVTAAAVDHAVEAAAVAVDALPHDHHDHEHDEEEEAAAAAAAAATGATAAAAGAAAAGTAVVVAETAHKADSPIVILDHSPPATGGGGSGGDGYGPEHHAAAVTIQKHARGYIARKQHKKEHEAASKIQKAYRTRLQRMHLAAIVVQAVIRGHQVRRRMRVSGSSET